MFLQWLQIFAEQYRPTTASRVLLVLDNDESHEYVEFSDCARENNVSFFLLHGARQQNAAFRHFGVRDIKAII
jgi:hypothetical protein